MHGTVSRPRRYLFLQGSTTPFLAQLGQALLASRHVVKRINFTAGDSLYWPLPGAVAYRGTLKDWPRFFEQYLNKWQITDIILFGDWRPLHVEAIRIATMRGLAVHVFEEGYLRPNWVTLEQGGVNNNSAMFRDPAWYLSQAAHLPVWKEEVAVESYFANRAVWDVVYHLWSALLSWRFPGYRTHLPLHPFREYACWVRRFLRLRRARQHTAQVLGALATRAKPFFVFPLQLDADSQLRINSSYGRLAPAIDTVLESFARHAPEDVSLLIKEHPLDPQLIDWRHQIETAAKRLGIGERVVYISGGDIEVLSRLSSGMVTVNSTSGVLALSAGVPVLALAKPIYAMPGLTFQGGLDLFWREATPPDTALFDAFRRVVAHHTQINGGFFSKQGLALAVQGALDRLADTAQNPALTTISPEADTIMPADEIVAQAAANLG